MKYAVAAAALLLGVGCPAAGAQIERPAYSLVDQHGSVVTERELRGHWLLVFFGFTQCPDYCPTAMQNAAAALRILGPNAKSLRVVFITVDPEHDTPAVLGRYLAHFDRRITGLTGSQAQLASVARAFGAYNGAGGRAVDSTSFAIEHSTAFDLIDPSGVLRRRVPSSATGAQLVHYLVRERGGAPAALRLHGTSTIAS